MLAEYINAATAADAGKENDTHEQCGREQGTHGFRTTDAHRDSRKKMTGSVYRKPTFKFAASHSHKHARFAERAWSAFFG